MVIVPIYEDINTPKAPLQLYSNCRGLSMLGLWLWMWGLGILVVAQLRRPRKRISHRVGIVV